MDYAKNTPLVPTSASICKESHQNEFATVKSITDEEKWHGLRKNTSWCPPLTVSVKNLTRMNMLSSKT